MTWRPLRLGTRGSALALAQSGQVADRLRELTGTQVELVEIVTPGDRSSAPIPQLGVGVFVSVLREALVAKDIDIAVHSYKDLPTAPADQLMVAAVPVREDPRDALIARDGLTLAQLPAGSRVGTGSARRMAQLRALGLPLELVPVRGNVDTRLGMVASGALDAVILARAGLVRLGRATEITEILDPELMLPAPAQGALAVECRIADADVIAAVSLLDDPDSRVSITAERALLARLEGGCSAPVAALAEVRGDCGGNAGHSAGIDLRGAVLSADGRMALRLHRTGMLTDAEEIGRLLAGDLLDAGAGTVLGVQE